jgi:hypothetical protein
MFGRFEIAVGAASLCLVAGSALAQFPPITDPTKDEAKCETSVGSTLAKFVGSKTKCISKCFATARKTSGPYTGCFGPAFTDPTTNACIKDTAKGAEVKAAASIVKACADAPGKDKCPECYNPAVCTDATATNPRVAATEAQVDPFGNLIYCTEAGNATPSKDVAKCEDAVVKALVKFIGSKTKCYAKCQGNELKGKIAPGSCTPPATDPATVTCISDPVKGAEAKTAAAIDKACTATTKPTCYGATAGAGWVALVESQVDSTVPVTACGSPSGAFLD